MSTAATTTTSQRQKLECVSTRMVYELMGISLAENQLGTPASTHQTAPSGTPRRSGKNAHNNTKNGDRYTGLDKALRQFYDKLPYNHGAQLCVEDLLSYIRKLRPSPLSGSSGKSKLDEGEVQRMVIAIVQYLEAPEFVDHLAAFGKLTGHPYILVFDPYAYQSKTPPTEEQSKLIDPAAFAESASGGTNTMMPSKAEQEILEKELEKIYNEKLTATKFKCPNPKCGESKFMRYHEVQARSVDEGSSYLYHCANCGTNGKIR